MYIQRTIEEKILEFLARKEAIAIIGPRQAGKTTMLEQLAASLIKQGKRVKYLTFDNRKELDLFQGDIDDFKLIAEQYDIMIIDEFQYARDGGKPLKYLYDTTKVKYIISGSSSLDLTFQTAKYMVGRMITFTLFPLSFREFLTARDEELAALIPHAVPDIFSRAFSIKNVPGETLNRRVGRLYEEYIRFGGYPAVVLSREETQKHLLLENLLSQYLLKDIQSVLHLATSDQLLLLVKALAAQIGNIVVYKELSQLTGLDYPQMRRHLEILRQTYLVDTVRPYFTNRRTELVKNPKVYFFDTGFRNTLLNDTRPFAIRNDTGSLVESCVFAHLARRGSALEPLRFWRTKSGAEVDFIVRTGTDLLPVEVKFSPDPSIGKSLYSYIEKFSPRRAYILTRGKTGMERVKTCTVLFVPVWYL